MLAWNKVVIAYNHRVSRIIAFIRAVLHVKVPPVSACRLRRPTLLHTRGRTALKSFAGVYLDNGDQFQAFHALIDVLDRFGVCGAADRRLRRSIHRRLSTSRNTTEPCRDANTNSAHPFGGSYHRRCYGCGEGRGGFERCSYLVFRSPKFTEHRNRCDCAIASAAIQISPRVAWVR